MILLFFIAKYFDVFKIVNNLIIDMKKNRNLEIIKTLDGSNSICDEEDRIYHSRYGAIQESTHIFIKNGLNICKKKKIKILEVGFGTGLNLILTYFYSKKKINYYALEPYPINYGIIKKINYEKILKLKILDKIHICELEKEVILNKNFSFFRYNDKFLSFNRANNFDIIYYDAFSPRAQPNMWTEENFIKAHYLLNKNGFLITFCAKGEVKRILKKVGFKLSHPRGPFGKREITLALKN